jgi:uncharacterized membrane protein
LFWGISKIFIKKPIITIGHENSLVYSYIFVSFPLLAYLFVTNRFIMPAGNALYLLLLTGLVGAIAIYALFEGFEIGKVSILYTVAHTSIIITLLLSFIFYSERLTNLQWLSVIILITGVALISLKWSEIKHIRHPKFVKGFKYAAMTAIGWGIFFFFMKKNVASLGPIAASAYAETLIFLFLALFVILRGNLKHPGKSIYPCFVTGVATALGSMFFALAVSTEAVSIIYPITNASVLVTALGSYIFLKERLEHNQKLAIFIILLGLILISL